MFKLVIDPGHGGADRGANYVVYESEVNLEIALLLDAAIGHLAWPVEIGFTRETDVKKSLKQRGKMAGEFEADFVLSLHCNAADSSQAHGLMAFHWPSNIYSMHVAAQLQRSAPAALYRLREKGYSAVPEQWDRVRNVLGSYSAPCVLVEMGFLTNSSDRSSLSSERARRELVACLLSGVSRMLTLHTREEE